MFRMFLCLNLEIFLLDKITLQSRGRQMIFCFLIDQTWDAFVSMLTLWQLVLAESGA